MPVVFCIRPDTRNIGNDVIAYAASDLIRAAFGAATSIITVPALATERGGGLGAAGVHDANRLADAVIVGGGNLFENGQLTVDPNALDALRVPLMLLGVSHGRIRAAGGALVPRTDAMPPQTIRALAARSSAVLVRDDGTARLLRAMDIDRAEVGGCPSLFLPPNPSGTARIDRVLLSIRHPARMNVTPELQWRVAADVRELVDALEAAYGPCVSLVCHDYADLEFARGFTGVPLLYFDDVRRYLAALRECRLSVTYRLHAFLPCVAFGTPSIHLSYDERGAEMVAAAGMREWDVDVTAERAVAPAVMRRVAALPRYETLRAAAAERIAKLRARTTLRLRDFASRAQSAAAEEAV